MFKKLCIGFFAALTAFVLMSTFYIVRSGLSLKLILFSAGDIPYIKNILPLITSSAPLFACLTGILFFAGKKHLVCIVSALLFSLAYFVLSTDFITLFLPGTLREDKEFSVLEQKQAEHSLRRIVQNYISLPLSDILRQNYVKTEPILKKNGKNVVFIMLESMESNFNNYNETNLIPNIEMLQRQHLSFGGRASLTPLSNTATATVAFIYGLPVKMYDTLWAMQDYNYDYLGAYPSIIDVYNQAGYQTAFIFGSDKKFAKTESLIKNAGFNEYWDKNKIISHYEQKYPLNDWGISDYDLYAIIKDKMRAYHRRGQPFFILAKTVETHFPQGHPSPHCPRKGTDMETAVFCTDKMLHEFLDWAARQSFYEDTLFIIVGDHLMMSCPFSQKIVGKRDCVFTVINSGQSGYILKRHSAFDIAPTVLELSGAKIREHVFGLGTSLLSHKPTLTERLGAEKLEIELNKKFFK